MQKGASSGSETIEISRLDERHHAPHQSTLVPCTLQVPVRHTPIFQLEAMNTLEAKSSLGAAR